MCTLMSITPWVLRCWDLVGNDQSGWGPSESISSNTRDQASRSASWDVLGTTANGTWTSTSLQNSDQSLLMRKVHTWCYNTISTGIRWDRWCHLYGCMGSMGPLRSSDTMFASSLLPAAAFFATCVMACNHGTLTRWRLTSLHPDLDVVTTKSSNISVQWWESMNSIFTWGGDYSCAKFTPKFHLHDLFIPLLGIDFAQPIEDGVIAGRSREVWQ